jgi:putative FmdB family regulatory protein
MPTYEYYCKNGHEYTEVRSIFVDQTVTKCYHCGEDLIQRIGNIGVTFNGSGFYRNDRKEK